jgi:hypothetical protein
MVADRSAPCGRRAGSDDAQRTAAMKQPRPEVSAVDDRPKSQTSTAARAERGELPISLAKPLRLAGHFGIVAEVPIFATGRTF